MVLDFVFEKLFGLFGLVDDKFLHFVFMAASFRFKV